ncbi:hypothetical protein TVAG_577540 [Trichomonas vaginalis G3]|uniref:F5/8 type C domain containing protein n=1 Tax=Trichomonas vaginalis (strain ATCC PRA-98 / G3) TaxID=412133 RepID=A2GQN2_TRIV3|nr:galactose-binding domain-like family [Trichomonas vaginalis G3]EAX80535.1 hypothetical protein TVAG_577540 [Trichomonas vaginalis G3]KAI5550405.1 galactose-binding domain-like family [Trichomonas vaginalis G3]|eukprot:XP_001293465.1 hypothetical protein [Trichomonas vaginalis G3]
MISFLICENILSDSNSIIKNNYPSRIIYFVSGSSSQYINNSVQKTKPEYAFNQIEKKYDWCSNCGVNMEDHPWIILGVRNRILKLDGYFLRAGCCTDGCCCYEEGTYCCDCCLFSWSFQISFDNVTWTTIHKVEKDYEMRRCKEKTYTFSQTYNARYVRVIQDQACPGDPPCMAINKIELIGSPENSDSHAEDFNNQEADEDDEVSIIGHVSRNGN